MPVALTQPAATAPFVWGSNGTMLTPDQISSQRQIADAMMAQQAAPQNVGEGLSAIGKALIARSMIDDANSAQTSGQQSAAQAFADLGDNPTMGALEAAAGNPFLNEGQSSVVKAMLANKLQQTDPKYQLDMDYERAQMGQVGAIPGYRKLADGTLQPIPGGPDDPNTPANKLELATKAAILGLDQAKAQGGGFYGDSDTAAAQRIIMTGDPASKPYAMAYQYLYGPKVQQQETPNGIVTFNVQNPPPSGVVAPTYSEPQTAAPAPPASAPVPLAPQPIALAPQASPAARVVTGQNPATVADRAEQLRQAMTGAPAPAATAAPAVPLPPGVSPAAASVQDMTGGEFSPITPLTVPSTANVVPGTAPYNESQARAVDLADMAVPDLATAISTYPALTNPVDQGLQKISSVDPTGIAHSLQGADYQRAYSATRSAISNILYTVSGAAIGDKELERKIDDLTPQFGDKPAVIGDKLNRLANYVASMASSTKDPATIQRAQQALAGIRAAQQKIAGFAPPASPSTTPVDLGASSNPAADYGSLPSGALYIAPGETQVRRKP